jgi:hypothetical protein
MQRRTKRVFTYKTRWSALLRTSEHSKTTTLEKDHGLRVRGSANAKRNAQPREKNQDHKNYTTKLCLKVETVERRIKDNLWAICVTGSSPEETKPETNVNDVLVSQKYTNACNQLCALHEPLAPMGAYAYS